MIMVSPDEVEAGTYDESGPYYEYAEVEYEYEDAAGEDDAA